jgi:hypothetical protein
MLDPNEMLDAGDEPRPGDDAWPRFPFPAPGAGTSYPPTFPGALSGPADGGVRRSVGKGRRRFGCAEAAGR